MRNYFDCVEELVALISTQENPIVWLMGGQQFGKSNIWLILLFWQYARQRVRAQFRMTSDESFKEIEWNDSNKGTVVFLDDCMYSGTQIINMVQNELETFIVCPYISKKALKKIDTKQKEGASIHVISRITPSSTDNAIFYTVRDEHGVETSLLKPLDISTSFSQVTWIFDHKIADSLSVPEGLFSNTPTLNFKGNLIIQGLGKTHNIHVTSIPTVKNFPLLFPCTIDPHDDKEPCYKPSYKEFGYRVTREL